VRIELLYSNFAIFARCVNSNKCVECEFFSHGCDSAKLFNGDFGSVIRTISTWHSFVHFVHFSGDDRLRVLNLM